MHREREARNEFFSVGDPFSNFRGFGMTSSIFGGRDPFDDPFFSRPFGSMFGPPISDFNEASSEGKGVVIEELSSDDEGDKEKHIHSNSGKAPSVEHPEDDLDVDEKMKNVTLRNDSNRVEGTKPKTHKFSFQTCKVTYDGVDGAYYSSTRTRSGDSDGVVFEETKEADRTTGQATHRISRGIHDKAHSVTRKLKSDGKVDTAQMLHNLEKDELAGFEEAWKGNIKGQQVGWKDRFDFHGGSGSGSYNPKGLASWDSWPLPSVKQTQSIGTTSSGKQKKVVRIAID